MGVLILGNYRQTLTVLRSLGRAGMRSIVGRVEPRDFSQYSRYAHEIWQHPDVEACPDEFAAALSEFLATRTDIHYLFPVGEAELAALMARLDQLPDTVTPVMVAPLVGQLCLDKARMYDLCAGLGVPLAATRQVHTYDELATAVTQIGVPCVVKPNSAFGPFGGLKAVIIDERGELARKLPSWPAGNESLIVQRFAPGHRHNCHVLAHEGELLAYFEQRVTRTDRPDDTGYAVDSISVEPTPALRDHCARFLRELRYSGVAGIQFLVDQGGEISFLELNPRLDATCALPFALGHDFPLLALQRAAFSAGARQSLPGCVRHYPAGKRGVWCYGELRGLAHTIASGDLRWRAALAASRRLWSMLLHADCHMTWTWRDPLPTCFLYAQLAWDGCRSRLGRILRPAHRIEDSR